MENWILTANSSKYDHANSFAENNNTIDWKQGNNKFEIGDIVFLYCTKPLQKIMYKCEVIEINIQPKEKPIENTAWKDVEEYEKSLRGKLIRIKLIQEVDNDKLNLKNLKANGLNGDIQGRLRLNERLLSYITENFSDSHQNDFYPEIIDESSGIYEGLRKQITINRYERNLYARKMCIEHHGVSCKVCHMDFKTAYGEIGNGFIHIHHLKPLSEIGKQYRVNYKKDLIPVCPNCHSMLHRKLNGKEITVDELKTILNKTR